MMIILSSRFVPLPRFVIFYLFLLLWAGRLHHASSIQQQHAAASRATTTTTVETYLLQGNEALASGDNQRAIKIYQQGVQLLPKGTEEGNSDDDDNDDDVSLLTTISLYTNLATAFSAEGQNQDAATAYEKALVAYQTGIDELVDREMRQEATAIAAQTAFFAGMVYQDLGQPHDAVEAYRLATTLDPAHWAAFGNLGSVFHDTFSNHDRALEAYNQAYKILTSKDMEPTDPPAEPRYILSQLQYRIGLCLSANDDRKCVIQDQNGANVAADCKEQAAHAFALAVEYDPDHESAKHMLATLTADATMKRASNTYVQSLFDDYAANFEHSLVEELGYTGYERLRRGFDRAMVVANDRQKSPPPPPVMFDLVIDAGCGTGLVGMQFRNVSHTLIGVDLSAAIIEQALQKRPHLYNDTRVGDITDVFREFAGRISLIIAGDSYIYFGDLVPLFEAMWTGLQEQGYVAFTLENVSEENELALTESKPDWRWQLTASGRFAHRREYVEAVALEHSFQVVHYEPMDGFRYERGVAVRGHLFIVQKQTNKKRIPNVEL